MPFTLSNKSSKKDTMLPVFFMVLLNGHPSALMSCSFVLLIFEIYVYLLGNFSELLEMKHFGLIQGLKVPKV